MIYKTYALYDTVSESYQLPTYSRNDDTIIRDYVSSLVYHKDSLLYSNPDDYLLYCIGTFDNETGHCETSLPRLVGRISEFLKRGVDDEN